MRISFILSTRRERLAGVLLALWIIIVMVLVVTFLPWFYDAVTVRFGVPELTGLSASLCQENYHQIVSYLSVFHTGPLQTTSFTFSKSAAIHFADVRHVFLVMQVLAVILPVVMYALVRHSVREGRLLWTRVAVWVMIVPGGLTAILALSSFDTAFTLMHKILFHNDYWLFNPVTDPSINLFPEALFAWMFGWIVTGMVIVGIVLWLLPEIYNKNAVP